MICLNLQIHFQHWEENLEGQTTFCLLLLVPVSFLARLEISFLSTFAPGRSSAVRAIQIAGLHMVNASKTCTLEGRPYCCFFVFIQFSVLYFVHSVLVVISVSR